MRRRSRASPPRIDPSGPGRRIEEMTESELAAQRRVHLQWQDGTGAHDGTDLSSRPMRDHHVPYGMHECFAGELPEDDHWDRDPWGSEAETSEPETSEEQEDANG